MLLPTHSHNKLQGLLPQVPQVQALSLSLTGFSALRNRLRLPGSHNKLLLLLYSVSALLYPCRPSLLYTKAACCLLMLWLSAVSHWLHPGNTPQVLMIPSAPQVLA